jgi:hypothetical protein
MKSIIEQFEDLVKKKAEVNKAQQPLLIQLNAVKEQINEFEEKRVSIRVGLHTRRIPA